MKGRRELRIHVPVDLAKAIDDLRGMIKSTRVSAVTGNPLMATQADVLQYLYSLHEAKEEKYAQKKEKKEPSGE